MGDLAFYLKEGWLHIISLNALDHQLFIVALTALYVLKDWQKVLVLVTAFTIGHSITLALSVYNVVSINGKWVEFLIACTILITALFNMLTKRVAEKKLMLNYFIALLFGLIHGLGFANTIRFMLSKDQAIAQPLLGFNIGLELGQILLVSCILILSYLVINKARLKRRYWVNILSSISLILALKFAIERIP
ncbi:MAG: HupE/UreJ family protein [Ferruginibacter sp.]